MAIRAMQPLLFSAITAPESKKLSAISVEVIRQTLQFLSPTVADMVRLQLITGMRLAKVCTISAPEIDQRGEIWVCKTTVHKMAHLGRERSIPLVQNTVGVIRRYFRND